MTFFAALGQRFPYVAALMGYAKPYRRLLVGGIVCMVVVAAATASLAKLIKPVIDDIFIQKNHALLLPITAAIIGVFLLKGLFSYLESILMLQVGQRIINDLQSKLFEKLMDQDLALFMQISSGDLLSRFTSDIQKLHTVVTGTVTNLFKDALTFIFFVAVMVHEDWWLTLMSLGILPLAVIPLRSFSRRLRRTATGAQEWTAALAVFLGQAFQGIRLIKSYGLEQQEKQKLTVILNEIYTRLMRGGRLKSANHPLMELLGGIAIAGVILYGGSQVITGTSTPGAFFAFITALLMSYEPLKRLTHQQATLQEQMAAAARVFSLMERMPTIQEKPTAKAYQVMQGEIIFENVHFYYEPGKAVLKELSLTVPAGKTVALVGSSGSGKSTLMNLIPRFFDPQAGQVLIDGVPVEDFTLSSLRQQIGWVSQEIMLFDDTIACNIGYGKTGSSLEEIISAAKAAAAHDFICALPQGYETRVGELGLRLSGGQRQRIAIARAFLKNAPLLLMDEPTSALDSQSEQDVQQALGSLMAGKTTFIIAHRLVTVKNADLIFVLEEGRLHAQGTHDELLKKNALYKHWCDLQLQAETPHALA